MDSRSLLIYSVTLLWNESQLDGKNNSATLVSDVVESIQAPEISVDTNETRAIVQNLKATAGWMAAQDPDYQYNLTNLKQRLKLDVEGDPNLYEIIEDGIVSNVDENQLKSRCQELRSILINHTKAKEVSEIIKKYYKPLGVSPKPNMHITVGELIRKLEPFASNGSAHDTHVVSSVTFSDVDAMAETLQMGLEELSTEGIMKCGWQGINRMLGEQGGFRRGNTYLISALQHNFKSGTLLNIPRQIAMYNVPYMIDDKKKPLILHISLENENADDMLLMYKMIKENMTNERTDLAHMKPAEAAAYMHEQISANGYEFISMRINPSDFSYRGLFDIIESYEVKGYEIHMLSLDYLNMIPKTGCISENHADRIQELYRRIRNFLSPRKITFLTAHQISTEGKKLVRMKMDNVVKEFANKGYYEGCSGVDREVDVEIVQHIEKPGDETSWLTFHRGKHRGLKDMTPDKDLYCAYKFSPIGAIPDDVNGKCQARRAVGGADENGDDGEWWAPMI